MTGKCAGGYKLPEKDKPCTTCGATSKEPCPEFIRQQQDEVTRLRFALDDIAQHSLEKYAVDVATNALALKTDQGTSK